MATANNNDEPPAGFEPATGEVETRSAIRLRHGGKKTRD